MAELMHRYPPDTRSLEGVIYEAHVFGREREDGRWEGWIEFHPVNAAAPVLRTLAEATRPDRALLREWAAGLEPQHLKDAFVRAA